MTKQSKTEHRGGKREGAGRKPGHTEALSVRQSKAFQRVAEELAKEFGLSMEEVIGRQVYTGSDKDKQTAANLFWKYSIIGAAEGGEADKTSGPAVYLPKQRPKLEAV